jgi:hypothetical protein
MTSEYIDSKDTSWHKARDIQGSASQYRNTIQVLAKTAVEPGQEKHYYFVYTDNNGKQYYLAGYPKGSFPDFKTICLKSGEYKPGSPDFKDSVRVGVISSTTGNPQEVYTTFKKLKSALQVIEDSNISYNPLTTNSNAAAISAFYAVNDIQFSRKSLPTPAGREDIKAPGQDISLLEPGIIRTILPDKKADIKPGNDKVHPSDPLNISSPSKEEQERQKVIQSNIAIFNSLSETNNSWTNSLADLEEMRLGKGDNTVKPEEKQPVTPAKEVATGGHER